MREIIKYSLIILTAALLGSCTEIDIYEDGRISYDEIFQNDKKTAAYLNRCYAYIEPLGMQYSDHTMLAAFSDEAHDARDVLNGSASSWYQGRMTPYYNPIRNGWWEHYWAGIRHCNIFLDNIYTARINNEINRNSWKYQAYAIRAYYYLQLIKRFGGVPIATEPYPMNFDYSQVRKNSFADCAKQIFADCDSALTAKDNELGWIAGSAESDRGKFTKAVVHAIKSQTALYAASPLWSDGTITWADAAIITTEALEACVQNGYSLYKSYPGSTAGYSPYDVYFYTRSDVNGVSDKETIYETKNVQLAIFKYCGLPITSGSEKAGICPSQELIDSYETINGKAPILGYKDANHLEPVINPEATAYNENNPYANRDPRLKASVYYNGAPYRLDDANSRVWTYEGGNCEISKTKSLNTRTGYYLRKFSNYSSDKNTNKDGYFKVFRLAELYLNMAEAVNEAAAAQGNANVPKNAINAVNTVRNRVGMVSVPDNITCDEFRKKVRNERRVELAFEEHRFFDVRRWKILSQTDKVVTGMKAIKNDGKYTYERIVVDNDRKAYDDKYLIFPIPGDEVIRLKEYTGENFQNPGWN
ncbi:Starch-binding associating with outer membrane [Mariniphaga anaerophila]|uniref:Starch-binding associating with outer membrane n=1 Tax=Mariniphaga anaerophila TaxID=1484053 RepID=A0A1M4WJL5_9BACT|nr:RagB/SusD family nutrient uptake outer membrane protein [Mariniphaga anaerophila]SHE81394.1 Starch-binding associating with outer membrane [Mariniphaga anaerophila]